MKNTLFTTAAILGSSALVLAVSNTASGRAIVENQCDYDVYIFDVPAANEGGSEVTSGALSKGQSWSQVWTGLTSASGSHDGWSIKISKTNSVTNDILQYEYTYQPTVNSDLVWLDLSSVDGTNNPWITDGWTLSSTESCGSALLQNISYTTPDDNAAMQPACPATADLTVVLCQWPGNAPSSTQKATSTVSVPNAVTALSSLVSSVVAPLTTTAASTTPTSAAAAAPTTSSATHSYPHTISFGGGEYAVNELNVVNNEVTASSTASPTTFATVVSSSADVFGYTVVEVETAFVTSYVTAEGPEPTEARKRHEHHAAHHQH